MCKVQLILQPEKENEMGKINYEEINKMKSKANEYYEREVL